MEIGNNCSLSFNSIVYTASHKTNSEQFEYYEKRTVLKNGVWLGARAIVLPGAIINNGCIVGAGSVIRAIECEKNGIYVGVPAIKVNIRQIENIDTLSINCLFR